MHANVTNSRKSFVATLSFAACTSVALLATIARAQDPFLPADQGGGAQAYVDPVTASMQSQADLLRAQGENANQMAQAALTNEEAYRKNLENQVHATNTYFEKQRLNAAYRAAEYKRPTAQQWKEIVDASAPKRLKPAEYQAARGKVYWPAVLRDSEFKGPRAQLDYLFARRDANSGVGSANYRQVIANVQEMRDVLKTKINSVSNMEYMGGKKFLDSLAYEARNAPTDTTVASK